MWDEMQMLHVQALSQFRDQSDLHTAEPVLPKASSCEIRDAAMRDVGVFGSQELSKKAS